MQHNTHDDHANQTSHVTRDAHLRTATDFSFSHNTLSSSDKTKKTIGNNIINNNNKHQHITCQDFIDSALAKFEGTSAPPDARAALAKLDKDSTGFLDRQRFALAMRGLRPSLELPPPLLLAAMDFFDTHDEAEGVKGGRQPRGSGGRKGSGRIDYRCV